MRIEVASIAMALLPAQAWCGAPFVTDDPVTAAAGRIELLAFYQSTLQSSERVGTLPGLEAHLGVVDGVEIDFVVPIAFDAPAGRRAERGYGDTTLALKYRIVEETAGLPLVSVVPKWVVPTGDASRGLGNSGSQVFLALAAQKTVGNFQAYANAGYWVNNGTNNLNYGFIGAQIQYRLSDAWILGAEVFHNAAQFTGESASTGFNVGGYYVFGPTAQLLFSAGRGVQNAAQTNRVSTYLGLQATF